MTELKENQAPPAPDSTEDPEAVEAAWLREAITAERVLYVERKLEARRYAARMLNAGRDGEGAFPCAEGTQTWLLRQHVPRMGVREHINRYELVADDEDSLRVIMENNITGIRIRNLPNATSVTELRDELMDIRNRNRRWRDEFVTTLRARHREYAAMNSALVEELILHLDAPVLPYVAPAPEPAQGAGFPVPAEAVEAPAPAPPQQVVVEVMVNVMMPLRITGPLTENSDYTVRNVVRNQMRAHLDSAIRADPDMRLDDAAISVAVSSLRRSHV